jgi:hypothetical protein
MSPRRTAGGDQILEVKDQVAKTEKPAEPDMSKVREWGDVAQQIQKLREGGADVPEICKKLQVSYVLVNQLILRSYKLAIDSAQVFERQEVMRLHG